MNTEITNAVNAANDRAQYDERAKRLLGHKSILAHILVDTVEEFKGMNPKDVVKYIEGEPMIGVVPTEPGLTNTNVDGKRLVGINTENTERYANRISYLKQSNFLCVPTCIISKRKRFCQQKI